MESVLGRYRNLIVLVGVLFAQILGLAVQVKRANDNEPTRLIRIWAVGAVTPLEKMILWVQTSTGNVWHNYLYLRGVRAENRGLKQQIERMSLEQARISQDADQARRLQALLGFKEQFISQTMAAQVIGGSGSESSQSVFIDKGYSDGIRPDMAVITADGIVGKVLRADPANRHVAQVLLINDSSSGVGAILEKTRLQGILKGTASGELMLEKVMSDENVPPGELVLTSGGDSIFPKGLPVGRVTKVATGSELFLNIRVRPSANLSKLEEVLVVTKIDERQAQPDHTGVGRAVDILAERLPSVPVKPEATAKDSAEGVAGGTATGAAAATSPGTSKPSGSDVTPKAKPPQEATAGGISTARKTTNASLSSGNKPATNAGTETTSPISGTTAIPPKSVKSTVDRKPQPAVEDAPY